MNHFHFPKLIATVGPSLAKETILSKVVNFVDIFKINLSSGFDDMKKKYIDTILKLDNSKTILLETKGSTIKLKNTLVQVKKGESLAMDYAEYQEDVTDTLLIDNKIFDQIPDGAILGFEENDLIFKVTKKDDQLTAVAQKNGKV
jgi:pyruvate kinase